MARPRERPSCDDPQAVALLCERLVSGMSMQSACATPDVPCHAEVYQRMAADAEFLSIIAQAREMQQHAIIDEIVKMADAATVEDWQVVKLKIWARQWQASKLAPKTYGDRSTIDANINGKLTLEGLVQQAAAKNESE
ncbi:MAG: hypothetical protein WAN65_10820 [Candidatus Sulfotelmatobacter sp.]